ncbi:MAG: succinate dehydrogenase, cytochrome b556 subunit [Anaerolineae bacterium]|nr:succinate dehydrogenase, cytochrome b556 subunit [Anaerolineae bacterium]MCI0609407.1 succinate dehydrogenase, cytochrome b556 subunit [Anaerolineae bacterium]
MNTQSNFVVRAFRWFDPRGRSLSGWGFMIHRLTALGLTFYLFLHLIVLGQLAQGPDAYDNFLKSTESPLYKIGELSVVAAVFLHGLNGVRIVMTSFGIAVPRQREIFIGAMVIGLVAIVIFGIRMFIG